jgi:hypothetical protein
MLINTNALFIYALCFQQFNSMTIDITTIEDFPTEYIDAFRQATNNEPLVLFHRNIHRLTEHIFSLPNLSDQMILSPSKATRYDEKIFDDLHTSNWWAEMQGNVGDEKVVIPLMVSSDATLVTGNGKKKAWPMYLTIGNVPKKYRYLKNYGASRVLAYLPVVTSLSNSSYSKWMPLCKMAVFHHCMRVIFGPFSNQQQQQQQLHSIPMTGPHGKVYSCVPMLATYSADYPEQLLLTGTRSWMNGYGCPRCLIKAEDFKKGTNISNTGIRNNDNMQSFSRSGEFGCMPINNAFWDTGFDIQKSIVVDDVHQVCGVYRHLLKFVEAILKRKPKQTNQVERRNQQLPIFSGLKRFKHGFMLSNLTNPTFDEFRTHMRLILCLVHDLIPEQCVLCLRAFVDFYIQISSKEHTMSTLKSADNYLDLFFYYLPAFQEESKMMMPKLHMLTKYTDDIKEKGPLDSYSTMHSERLHKTNAKQPSKRTNFRDAATFTRQLVRFVEDRDILFDMYGPTTTQLSTPTPHSIQHPSFTLTSQYKETVYQNINSLEQHHQNLRGLHTIVRLYLHTLTSKSTRPISIANCPQLGSEQIKTYGQLQINETNDDASIHKTHIRVGFFYNNNHNDCIRAADVTKSKVRSQFQHFFGKVYIFIEVLYNNKIHRLCIGQLFKETNLPHLTGYKTLLLMSKPRPELFVCCVEHILEKVFIVPDFGDENDDTFLLNHDVSQHSWTNASPIPYELDDGDYTGWAQIEQQGKGGDDSDVDDIMEKDGDDGNRGSDSDNDSDSADDEDLAEFVLF